MEKAKESPAFRKHLSPLKISLHNTQRDLPISTPHVRKVVSFLLSELKISTHEIIIHFVSEKKICTIHKDFFNDPTPTDCMTFPLDPPSSQGDVHHILGEAFICPKTAIDSSKRLKINPYLELYRYLIHCILHMIGYTDTTPASRAEMKKKENACLKKLVRAGLVDTP